MRVKEMKSTETTEEIDNKILESYKNAENISLIPLLKLIYKTTNLDLSNKYQIKPRLSSLNDSELSLLKSGEITLTNGNNKVHVYLDIVDKEYNLMSTLKPCNILSNGVDNLMDETNIKLKTQLIEVITYLTQAINITFDNLKNVQRELVEFNLVLDNNTTMYLDYDLDSRVGIIFK